MQSNPEVRTLEDYLYRILSTQQSLHPGSILRTTRGRSADVTEYTYLIVPLGTPTPKIPKPRDTTTFETFKI